MLIKYKGNTSSLLTDLSLELKIPVNLKASESILQVFFEKIMKELSLEKSIDFISDLPPCLKPFCFVPCKESLSYQDFFSKNNTSFTIQSIMKVLEKYIQPEKQAKIYSFFPEALFSNSYSLKNPFFV